MEEDDADEEGGGGADAGPDGVGSADGDVFLGDEEEDATERHSDDCEENPDDAGGGMERSKLHANRPANFAHSGEEEIKPRHTGKMGGLISEVRSVREEPWFCTIREGWEHSRRGKRRFAGRRSQSCRRCNRLRGQSGILRSQNQQGRHGGWGLSWNRAHHRGSVPTP